MQKDKYFTTSFVVPITKMMMMIPEGNLNMHEMRSYVREEEEEEERGVKRTVKIIIIIIVIRI